MGNTFCFTVGQYSKFSFNSEDFNSSVEETHRLIENKSHFVITYEGKENYKQLKKLFDAVDSEFLFNNGYQLYGLSCELKKQDEPLFKKYLAKRRIKIYESDNGR